MISSWSDVWDSAWKAVGPEDSDRDDAMPMVARRLGMLTAIVLGAVLPMAMVVANKSAPATLGAAALLAHIAVWRGGYGQALLYRYRSMALKELTLLVAIFGLICVLSLTWSIDPALSRRGLVEAFPELVFAFMLAAAWPMVASRRDFRWLSIGLVGSAVLIVFEHRLGMPLHALTHARGEAWDLKRSAIPPLLLLWPALAYGIARARPALAALLIGAVAVGIVVAHSGAPGFALVASAAFGLLARFVPKTAIGMVAAGLVLLVALAPWTGTIASYILPAGVENALAEEHAAHRVRIWTAFEARARDRWITGHGFDASFKVSQAPLSDGTMATADNADMLNNHPHNVFLELWVELGMIGAVAALGVCVWTLVRLSELDARCLAPRLALFVSVIGVGLVGLSAWQPWWLATIAVSLLWFDLLAARFDA